MSETCRVLSGNKMYVFKIVLLQELKVWFNKIKIKLYLVVCWLMFIATGLHILTQTVDFKVPIQ